jgi:PST family polysaccharide transporter
MISIQLYANLNKLIVGTFLGMTEVAIYDLAEKIAGVLRIPILMIKQAVFPKISREKNISFINKMMFSVTGIVIAGYICIFISSKWLIIFFMNEYIEKAVYVIWILTFSIIPVVFNIFIADCRLIPFGYNRDYMRIVIAGSLFFLCCIGGLWLFKSIHLYTLTVAILGVRLFVCGLAIYTSQKHHLLFSKK